MDIEGDSSVDIFVEFENLPCSYCLKPGHIASICPQITGKRPITSSEVSPPSKPTPQPKPLEAGILGPPPSTPAQQAPVTNADTEQDTQGGSSY